GRATSRLFAREGAKLVTADVTGAQEQTANEIRDAGGEATAVHVDVTNESDVKAMLDKARQTYGRIDILYNNAGVLGELGALTDCTEQNFDRIISTNLKGVFFGLKHGLRAIAESGGGAIVNTASIAGLVGLPGLGAYCASKGGVIQLTRTAALEGAAMNVRVNCVCPGGVNTPMVQNAGLGRAAGDAGGAAAGATLGATRIIDPEEIGRLVLFLASDDASAITGGAYPIDLGVTAR
ncbi:MAG TPA: SDR family oxidoreductase, partial [Dehalococcoidia bacterium]|nr:SDR family oxidoreductase [Dehalococcoidia bacterium]